MRPKPHVLFAWIGFTDIQASSGTSSAQGPGPIFQALSGGDFTHVVLLSNYQSPSKSPSRGKATPRFTSADAESYCSWLRIKYPAIVLRCEVALLSRPVALDEIYRHAKRVVEESIKRIGDSMTIGFHLSPGTPEMAGAWILLSGLFKAELIESSQAFGTGKIEVPFDISVEYVPDLLKKANEDLYDRLQALPPATPEWKSIVHRSGVMKVAILDARVAAHHEFPVLLLGETGTGKELFARAIHAESDRRNMPFCPINCGAIAGTLLESELFGHEKGAFTDAAMLKRGVFESAESGTVFLDEIGEMPLEGQVKLLRVLQEGRIRRVGGRAEIPINARVIAATNRSLMADVSAGRFREDLYYRLLGDVIVIPPLHEREGDIGLLIDHFCQEAARLLKRKISLSAAARRLLQRQRWRGNVRELRSTVLRACVKGAGESVQEADVERALCSNISSVGHEQSLPDLPVEDGFSLDELHAELDRKYIALALDQTAGNKARAARLLGFSNSNTLSNRAVACGMAMRDDSGRGCK